MTTHTQEHTYSRNDLNHSYSKGFEDGYERGYTEGEAYARAEINAFLALGGTFRGMTDSLPLTHRLRLAWCAFVAPARLMRSPVMRAAQYLQGQGDES